MVPKCPAENHELARLQAEFLAILPSIERWVHNACRDLDSFHDREDAVADAIADA